MGRISMPQGHGSLMHNRRDYAKYGMKTPDNIDPSRTKNNVILRDLDLKDAYVQIFGQSVTEYNSRQKRNDRKINDYLDHIKKSKNGEKPFYEDVLQWGTKEDYEKHPELRSVALDCLQEYVDHFDERNPNLALIGAYIHMDEASPHLHFDYIPVATGYKQGMKTRNSLDKAMKQMGYTPEGEESKHNNATKNWKNHERAYFAEICRKHGLQVEDEEKSNRRNLTVKQFKEEARELDQRREEAKKYPTKEELAFNRQVMAEVTANITEYEDSHPREDKEKETSYYGRKNLLGTKVTYPAEVSKQLETMSNEARHANWRAYWAEQKVKELEKENEQLKRENKPINMYREKAEDFDELYQFKMKILNTIANVSKYLPAEIRFDLCRAIIKLPSMEHDVDKLRRQGEVNAGSDALWDMTETSIYGRISADWCLMNNIPTSNEEAVEWRREAEKEALERHNRRFTQHQHDRNEDEDQDEYSGPVMKM